MKNIDSLYVVIGALYLVIGMLLGIVMGMHQDFTLAPVHAHIDLVGFSAHCVRSVRASLSIRRSPERGGALAYARSRISVRSRTQFTDLAKPRGASTMASAVLHGQLSAALKGGASGGLGDCSQRADWVSRA